MRTIKAIFAIALAFSIVSCSEERDSDVMAAPVRGGRVIVVRHDHINSSNGLSTTSWKVVTEHRILGIFPIRKTLIHEDRERIEVKSMNDSVVEVTRRGTFGGVLRRNYTIPH